MAKYRIGLGVSGGIAVYKAVEVMRLLQKSGCDVTVAMTRHATEFVRPLTFRALSKNHVIVDDYDAANPDPIAHINFSQNIDLLLIVPATANIIAKFASGVADDFLSSTYLASISPVLIAPAMNTAMWDHPATQRNLARLRADGVHIVQPIDGELACETVGTGKLEDVENIVEQALRLTSPKRRVETGKKAAVREAGTDISHKRMPLDVRVPMGDFRGEKVLLTVGGTREAIDPVRFISNRSSGRMGFALAEAALRRGAEVTVVAGSTTAERPVGLRVINAVSAVEMHAAVMNELPEATIFIGAAAVADYAPATVAGTKIKKDGRDAFALDLVRTPDILADVSKNRIQGLLVVGFAAETDDVISHARSKLTKKDLDMVVANDITKSGAGFDADTNIATVLTRSGREIELPLMLKREMADRILDEVAGLR